MDEAVCLAIEAGVLKSAHDCSEGGIAVTLAESCIAGGVGATVRLPAGLPPALALFSESQGRVVVSLEPQDMDILEQICQTQKVPFQRLGTVGGDRLAIEHMVDVPVAELAGRLRHVAREGRVPGDHDAERGAARGLSRPKARRPDIVHVPRRDYFRFWSK